MNSFKENVLAALIEDLKKRNDVLAIWEAGSAANGSSDQYSDIDLGVLTDGSSQVIHQEVESTLDRISSIQHRYIEPGNFWPGYYQRVYFLEGAPKHFFVDVGVLLHEAKTTLAEFLQIERHGNLVVHFDKLGVIKPTSTDLGSLRAKQKKRLEEIEAVYPVYRTEVLKELDRGHSIDAFAFYFGGMLKPLVELLGILHRPFRFDFGMRYLHKTFPQDCQENIEKLLYVPNADELAKRVPLADSLFKDAAERARKILEDR